MSKDDVYVGAVALAVILASVAAFFIALIPNAPLGLGHYNPPMTAPVTSASPKPSLADRPNQSTPKATPTQGPTESPKVAPRLTQSASRGTVARPSIKTHAPTPKPTPKPSTRATPQPTPKPSQLPLINLPTIIVKLPLLPTITIP